VKAVHLLAVLPFVGFFSGTWVVRYWGPLLFRAPTLLIWNLTWMLASAGILWIIYAADNRSSTEQP
jgi:hypothetical protein